MLDVGVGMIRFAETKDILQIRSIWKICFGDVDDYLDSYFSFMFKENQTLLMELDDQIVAMLQMLPAYILTSNGKEPIQYIFAAATLPAYRKRGLMAELIEEAIKTGESRSEILSVLKPTNQNLFHFYEQLGYQMNFYIDKIRFSREDLLEIVKGTELPNGNLKQCDVEELYKLRELFLKGRQGAIFFPQTHIKAEMDNFNLGYGGVFSYQDCYAFCREDVQSITCTEFSFSSQFTKEFCALLLKRYPHHKEFTFILPQDTPLFGKTGETQAFGMSRKIKPLELPTKPYLNMALE